MNTLSKTVTQSILGEGGYEKFDAQWKSVASNSVKRLELRPVHYLIAALVRGKDYRKGFKPITNARKLAHGGSWGFKHAVEELARVGTNTPYSKVIVERYMRVFGDSLTVDQLKAFQALTPTSLSINELPAEAYVETAVAAAA